MTAIQPHCIECNKPATHTDPVYDVPLCKAHLQAQGTFLDCTVCGKALYEDLIDGGMRSKRVRVYPLEWLNHCWPCYEEMCRIDKIGGKHSKNGKGKNVRRG